MFIKQFNIKKIFSILVLLSLLINCQKKYFKYNYDEKSERLNYSIESIKKRNFTGSIIIIKEKLNTNKNYDSYIISYRSDGLKIYALMNVPKIKKKKYPVVIVNHGYIRPDIYSVANSYKTISGFFAENGFLVLKPDYRGHDKSEKNDQSIFNYFAYTVDVLNLINSLDSLYIADLNNIFMYGHSMGGGITITVLETTNKIKAATLWAPVSSEFPESVLFYARRHNNNAADKIKEYIETNFDEKDISKFSILNYAGNIKTPLIIHHGTDDKDVPYEWSINFINKLKELNVKYTFYTYEGENHNLSKYSYYKVLKKDVDFFKSVIQ